MRRHDLQLIAEFLRFPKIIRIDEGHELSPCMGKSEIARCAHTAIHPPFMVNVTHGGCKALSIVPRYRGRRLRRSVINENQFEILEILAEHALDRFRDETLAVQEDQNDRDFRYLTDRSGIPSCRVFLHQDELRSRDSTRISLAPVQF